MRNVMKSLAQAACAALFFANAVSANPIELKECQNNTCEKFRVGMYRVRNTVTMNLLIEKQKGERLAVRLLDQKGKILMEDIVPKNLNKFGTKLNFSEIQDGVYTLEVADGSEKVVKSIYLSTNEVREVNRTLLGVN
ncbi:hypothetical protein [Dyadobacter luticola]|uniref:T9SS type A sorting domain-containing protein n=1 Tax=Dyadobacter luticola TaxID=1979387 RepID=A0A5R9KS45_9BACT|nr:hypothetical protein [Dyadobacter luticola]TLU98906.1 hypothetical protein FEN17_20150 [Dyadobacter luticola]